jgi:type I restriction enzyme M protein
MRLNHDGKMTASLAIDQESAIRRLDYDYHVNNNHTNSSLTLDDLGAHVVRGSLENAKVRNQYPAEAWAFHTTDFPCEGFTSTKLKKQKLRDFPPSTVWAEPGDILVARVDRNLHRKVCIVTHGKSPVTECVFRIRLAPQWQQPVLRALTSPAGKARLQSTARGVAARMIARSDLVRMPLDISNDE